MYRKVIRGKGNTGRGEMLPFDLLADGQWRHVRPTIDFDATQIGFKSALYAFARRWWIGCELKLHNNGTVTFKLGPLGDESKETRARRYTPIVWPPKRDGVTLALVAGPGDREGPDLFPGQVLIKS